MSSAVKGHVEVAKELLMAGADVNAKNSVCLVVSPLPRLHECFLCVDEWGFQVHVMPAGVFEWGEGQCHSRCYQPFHILILDMAACSA